MIRPSPRQLFAEAARLAQVYHWSLDEILDMEHADRHRFLEQAEVLDMEELERQRALYDEYVSP